MTEPADDILTRPLGVDDAGTPPPKTRAAGLIARARQPWVVTGIAAALLVSGFGLLVALGDPQGGEPSARAMIDLRDAPPAPKAPEKPAVATLAPPQAESAPPQQRSAEELENASGVTVFRPPGTAPSEAVVIRVPPANAPRLAAAPDPRLAEQGRHGIMPRLGEGRLRALDVYARPEEPGSGPRIAILVTGLGIGQSATAAATARLPQAVSLAFAPYGNEVERAAARARDAGHEVFLQVPMEPFDYPDSDPGPQALLAALKGPENGERLAWAMSRFPGYVGLVNLMGGKLIADPAFEPILREIGARGLGFVEDGTVPKGPPPANKTRTPYARAEIVLDAVPRPEAIDTELARAETQARANGFVLVSSGGSLMSVDRIARWARNLDAKGIRLVPVSVALRGAPKRLSKAD